MLRAIKIIVSVSLIGVLLWNLDRVDLRPDLRNMDLVLGVLAVLFGSLQYPISAWKWQTSLRLHGLQYRFWYLLRVLCIAFFFNNFLPTAIGGDAYRAYRTISKSTRPAYPISAVILERLIGIAALAFLGYLSAIYLVYSGALVHQQWVGGAVIAVTVGLIFIWIFWRFGVHEKIWASLQKIARLEPLYDSIRVLNANRQHFAQLIGLSLLFQGLAIVIIALLFAALDLPGRLAESGFTAAAAGVGSILPLSINGIGVVEGLFVAAAWETGLPYAEAVLVALLLRAFMLVSSLWFGLLYAVEPKDDNVLHKETVS